MSYIRSGTWVTFSSLQKLDHFMGTEQKIKIQTPRKKEKKKRVILLKVEQATITIVARDMRPFRMVNRSMA